MKIQLLNGGSVIKYTVIASSELHIFDSNVAI